MTSPEPGCESDDPERISAGIERLGSGTQLQAEPHIKRSTPRYSFRMAKQPGRNRRQGSSSSQHATKSLRHDAGSAGSRCTVDDSRQQAAHAHLRVRVVDAVSYERL